jgi:hypothetical protein
MHNAYGAASGPIYIVSRHVPERIRLKLKLSG